MSLLTSLTSLWQDSTLFVSSCSCVRISHRATVVSSWRSPRCCSSSSLALKFILITLTCFCRLRNTYTTIHVLIHLINCILSPYNKNTETYRHYRLDQEQIIVWLVSKMFPILPFSIYQTAEPWKLSFLYHWFSL